MSVFPSVRMEQLGYHWKNFHDIQHALCMLDD
jgi:hypothetical protein